jgi:hypothetical protein
MKLALRTSPEFNVATNATTGERTKLRPKLTNTCHHLVHICKWYSSCNQNQHQVARLGFYPLSEDVICISLSQGVGAAADYTVEQGLSQ